MENVTRLQVIILIDIIELRDIGKTYSKFRQKNVRRIEISFKNANFKNKWLRHIVQNELQMQEEIFW
jgi:alkyl hydroperoxide reductase subunit AhpC